ncbi:MAG: hypothetical protein ACR2JU_02390 [Nocardioidaceae bacterium]
MSAAPLAVLVAVLVLVVMGMLVGGLTAVMLVRVPVLTLDALFAPLTGILVTLLPGFQVLLVATFVVVLVVRVTGVLVTLAAFAVLPVLAALLPRVVLRFVHRVASLSRPRWWRERLHARPSVSTDGCR